jgi:hypothetical protein
VLLLAVDAVVVEVVAKGSNADDDDDDACAGAEGVAKGSTSTAELEAPIDIKSMLSVSPPTLVEPAPEAALNLMSTVPVEALRLTPYDRNESKNQRITRRSVRVKSPLTYRAGVQLNTDFAGIFNGGSGRRRPRCSGRGWPRRKHSPTMGTIGVPLLVDILLTNEIFKLVDVCSRIWQGMIA